jgi:hypothetical protein
MSAFGSKADTRGKRDSGKRKPMRFAKSIRQPAANARLDFSQTKSPEGCPGPGLGMTVSPTLSGPRHPRMSAVRLPTGASENDKADTTFRGSLLSRSLLGVRRTWPIALHMSACAAHVG